MIDNFFNRNIPWNLLDDFDDSLNNNFMRHDFLLNSFEFNNLVNDLFHNSIDFDVHILLHDNFLNTVLDDRNLNYPFNFLDPLLNNDLRNHPLYYLNHFDDFLHNSRHHDNFFHDFFDFNDLRNFDHFLYDLLHRDLHFFDTVDMSENFNDLFFDILDGLGNLDVMVNNLFHFNSLRFADNDGISDFHYHRHLSFNDLDNRLFNNLCNLDDSLVDDWNFNYSLDLSGNFLDSFNYLSHYLFNLFDPVHKHDLLHNYLNGIGLLDSVGNLYNLLDHLRNFHYSFFPLNYHHRLFNNSIHNNVSNFDVVLNLLGSDDVHFLHDFLDNLFHLDNFRDFDHFLYNFLNVDRNFDYFFNNFLNWDYFFLVDDDLLDFSLDVVNDLSHSHRLFNFNNFLHNPFNFNDLGDFPDNLDDSVLNSGYFDCLLDDLLHLNHFVLNSGHDDRHLDGNRNVLYDFSNLLNFDNLLDDSFNNDDLGHFNDAVNDLFNDLFNFNDLRDNSEDLKNVVNIDNSHYLLIYHADDALVDFQSHSSLSSYFFQFLKESFDQDTQVELNFSRFFGRVSVDIVHLDH